MKSTISFCINIKRKSNSIHLLTEGEFSCNFLVYRPEKRKEKYLLEKELQFKLQERFKGWHFERELFVTPNKT